jgi:hypothetical protein
VADVVEVLEHWAAGRPLRAIAKRLGLDRNTVAKYVGPARQAGFGPGTGPPGAGWAAFVAEACPELGKAPKNGAAWDELATRHDEIVERLNVNRPSTVWQRMHDDAGLLVSRSSSVSSIATVGRPARPITGSFCRGSCLFRTSSRLRNPDSRKISRWINLTGQLASSGQHFTAVSASCSRSTRSRISSRTWR